MRALLAKLECELNQFFPARRHLYDMGMADAALYVEDIRAFVANHLHGHCYEIKAPLVSILSDHFRQKPTRYKEWHPAYMLGVVEGLRKSLESYKTVSLLCLPFSHVFQGVPHKGIPQALRRVDMIIQPSEAPNNVVPLRA